MSNDSHTLQEFLWVLRRALLMIVRWIEKNDPGGSETELKPGQRLYTTKD